MHRHIPETGLTFKLFRQGEKAPLRDGEFSNVLALTVFHHSSNPVESVVDVARVARAGGRVIVVESVFGVDGKQLSLEMQTKVAGYVALSGEQQRKVNVFFDHFYNRILHYSADAAMKVNVPFNFNTPDGWRQVFLQNGLVQEEVCIWGWISRRRLNITLYTYLGNFLNALLGAAGALKHTKPIYFLGLSTRYVQRKRN
jgi:SAM-dependent methyltransferase